MKKAEFAEMIRGLPRADIPLDGVVGWLAQGEGHQVVFFEIEPIGAIPPHSHGAQWGIVVEGEMELTVDDHCERYGPGESYYIPAGVVHSARFLTRFRAIDVFAEGDRYAPRPNE